MKESGICFLLRRLHLVCKSLVVSSVLLSMLNDTVIQVKIGFFHWDFTYCLDILHVEQNQSSVLSRTTLMIST